MSNKTPASFSAANLDAIYNGWPKTLLVPGLTGVSFGTAKHTAAASEGKALLTRASGQVAVTGAANNGSGAIRMTVGAAQFIVTGNKVFLSAVGGVPNANGLWTITRISSTQFDLIGSTFAGAYTSGGLMRIGWGWVITDGGSTLLDNIVASYTLNSVLTDATGLSGTATMVGITYVAGKTGNAAVFNAATDVIDIADTSNLTFTDGVANDVAFSINLWAYFTAFSSIGNWLINKRGDTETNKEWQFVYSTGNNYLQFQKFDKAASTNNRQSIASPVAPFVTGQWYNVTITDDGSKTFAGMKMYINGVLQAASDVSVGTYTGMPTAAASTTSITRMGNGAWTTADATIAHQGYLEDVSVWRRALTQEEVTYLYSLGTGKTYPFL